MKKIYKLTVAVALLLFGAISSQAQEPDVYVGGIKNNFASIWKNGVAQTNNGWEVSSMIIAGEDFYVAGLNDSGIPIIKKNDELIYTLECETECMGSSVSSIAVHENDVYATTIYLTPSGHLGRLWKNGVIIEDYSCATELYAVYIDGDDIYVAGGIKETGVIWKNAEQLYTYPTSVTGLFVDVKVVDGDVYYIGGDFGSGKRFSTAGVIKDPKNADINQEYNRYGISVWKNGEVLYSLGSPIYGANILVSDGVIYAGGQVPNGSIYQAKLWIDGVGYFIQNQWSGLADIYEYNGELYITGFVGSYPELDVYIWKDGENNIMNSPGYDEGNCIVVVGTVDVEEENENSYNIYPNPANDCISIEGIIFDEAVLYNNKGQIILKSNNNNIDVSTLESGLYLLKLDNNITKKIIIKH